MTAIVNYIICAAGKGSRFQEILPNISKPCIELHGLTLLEWSLRSLPLVANDRLIIVTQSDDGAKNALEQRIKELYPWITIVWEELSQITRGQLETAYLMQKHCDAGSPLVIYNCDTYFESKTLLPLMADESIEGLIPCSQEPGEQWSFCAIAEDNRVVKVAEKERISPWASVGFYFFRDSKKFFECALETLNKKPPSNTEYYVAPLYQRYIASGAKVLVDRVHAFRPMGSPQQISTYWGISENTLKQKNARHSIVIDLDNTLTIDEKHLSYAEKRPNIPIINKLKEYKAKGYEIIIYSSRRMLTHRADEAKILKDIGSITLDWLNRHNVPFDGLKFGKPYAQNGFYVDDRAIRPEEFLSLTEDEIRARLASPK